MKKENPPNYFTTITVSLHLHCNDYSVGAPVHCALNYALKTSFNPGQRWRVDVVTEIQSYAVVFTDPTGWESVKMY